MIIQRKYIRSITKYFGHIEPDTPVILACPIDDENHHLLNLIGFSENATHGETILPARSFGRVSVFNAEGKDNIRKDLPKETAYRQIEWTRNEFRGRYDTEEVTGTVEIPYQRFPREFIPPPSAELSYYKADGEKYIGSQTITFSQQNHDLILHTINLLLEIFGECHILSKDFQMLNLQKIKRVNWEVLPAGEYPWEKLASQVEPILEEAAARKRPVIKARLQEISKYSPDFVAVGRAGFSGYLVFGFSKKNIFICESAFYGNATYVFDVNWKSLSALTKAEILENDLHKARIIHRENSWESNIRQLLG